MASSGVAETNVGLPLCSARHCAVCNASEAIAKNCIVLPKIACSSTVWGEDQVVINAFLHFDSKQICAFFAQLKNPTLHTTALFSLQTIPRRKMQSHL